MNFKTSTPLMQTLVAKAMKGASNNKMMPITGLLAIELKDGKLTLTTTDSSNYLYVKANNVTGDNFYVVVQADMFSKLISKLTCDEVEFILNEDKLTIKGNGTYSIELPLDEEGKPVIFPNPLSVEFTPDETAQVNLDTFRVILETAKASISTSLDVPCYTGYYTGNKVVTTDTYKMCGIDKKLWATPALISVQTMDLLNIFDGETVTVKKDSQTIIFESDNCIVYGKLMDCLSDFQIDVINGLLGDEFSNSCKVSKLSLLQLLDRLSLFVGVYDKNSIYLTFGTNGLTVSSKQANSTELIEYLSSTKSDDNEFTCSIDIEMFRSQVKANLSDAVEIHYGKDNAIKLTDGDITQVVALMTE